MDETKPNEQNVGNRWHMSHGWKVIYYATVISTSVHVVLLRIVNEARVPLAGQAAVVRHEVTGSAPRPSAKTTSKRNTEVAELALYCRKLHLGFSSLLNSSRSYKTCMLCVCVFILISTLIWWYQRKKPAWPLLKTARSGRLEIFSLGSAVLEAKIFIIRTFSKTAVCLPLSNENLERSSHLYQVGQTWPWRRHTCLSMELVPMLGVRDDGDLHIICCTGHRVIYVETPNLGKSSESPWEIENVSDY